jgi:hypothetical protein
MQPSWNIQHVNESLLKPLVPEFLSFGEGNVDSSLRNNTSPPLFHNKIPHSTPFLFLKWNLRTRSPFAFL